MKKRSSEQGKSKAPGPKPDLLKIKRSWKKAIKQSPAKKKLPEGWPK